MGGLGLAEAIKALHTEIEQAVRAGAGRAFQFPVERVELEFHIGVTRTRDAKKEVKFWVVEMGGGGSFAREEIQTVRVTLGAPVGPNGERTKVGEDSLTQQ